MARSSKSTKQSPDRAARPAKKEKATRPAAVAKTRGSAAGRDRGKTMGLNASPEERRFLSRYRQRLSPTTLRAKWIHSPQEHEDRPGQSLATRNHEVIRHWAQQRGAQPATIPSTRKGDRPGVLRFVFGQTEGGRRRLEPVDWSQWLRTFDERKLVFLFQEHRRNGGESNFFRFDSPLREEA